MVTIGCPLRCAAALVGAALATAALAAPAGPSKAGDAAGIVLAPHRAIYDLKLADARGKRSLEAVRGRIVYDFAGSVCEGYALQFRQVTELNNGEGKVALSDLRSTSWEEGDAQNFRFRSQNYLDRQMVDEVDGQAKQGPQGATVSLVKPKTASLDIGRVAFPSEHMRRIIAAARAAEPLLELTVYDGSETGEKVYQSLTVIGHKIPPDERKPADAAAGQAALAGLDRWPVTISYFDRSKHQGEQMPVYAISFEVYDNGIARALVLDYGDFTVSGTMSTLEIKDAPKCK